MPYKILVAPKARRDLAGLPRKALSRVDTRILALASDPRPADSKKLKGSKDFYRIRAGNYRVIYEIRNAALLVLVVRVVHRKDIYRNL